MKEKAMKDNGECTTISLTVTNYYHSLL